LSKRRALRLDQSDPGATHPDYLRNRPTAWLNGFSIVELYTANGFFNLYPVVS
jgi:hypothetical protein